MIKFFFKILKKTGIDRSFNFFLTRKINKTNIVVPVIGEIGKGNLYAREIWMHEVLKLLCTLKQGILIDVGVNIGQTLIHYKTAFPNGGYIGFEPSPDCIFYVQQLIQSNNWDNCKLLPCAIFERSELTEINYYSASTDSMATVIDDFRSDRRVIKKEWIPSYNSEAILKILTPNPIAVIKVDVEGAELEVIKELVEIIQSERPFVIVELLPPHKGNEVNGLKRIEQINELFQSLNYRAIRIYKNTDSSLLKLEAVNSPLHELTRKLADHIFCPEERWPFQSA